VTLFRSPATATFSHILMRLSTAPSAILLARDWNSQRPLSPSWLRFNSGHVSVEGADLQIEVTGPEVDR
jgi:hypothetical protein